MIKGLIVHLALLAVSGVSAFAIWTDDHVEKPKANEVEIWHGLPDQMESIRYETPSRTVKMESRKDALGNYYIVHLDKAAEAPAPPSPHGGPAGNPMGTPASKQVFIGVKEADELAKKLASLKALRAIGKVAPARFAEFGLDKPEGTLKLKLAGKEHVLAMGATSPGGGEQYVKYAASNEIFAIDSDITRALDLADTRLMERAQHGFDPETLTRVRVSRGGKSRDAVRVADKRDSWADPTTPTKVDETLGNWISKLDRMHVTDYVEKPSSPPRPEDMVARVEYFSGPKSLGFLELYKLPGAEKEAQYLARTEYSRWYMQMFQGTAEQVDQDLGALLK